MGNHALGHGSISDSLSSLTKGDWLVALRKLLGGLANGEIRGILALLLPLILVELFESALSITDTFFVSGLGDSAVAAVGFSGYISWVFNVSLFVFFVGTIVLVSQAFGSGNRDLSSRIVSENLVASAVYGVILASLSVRLAGRVVEYAGRGLSEEVVKLSADYLVIRLYGLPIASMSLVLDASIRSVGLNKYLTYSYLISVVANVALDPVLIYGYLGLPRMGVRGAALASLISQAILLAALARFSLRLPFKAGLRAPSRAAIESLRVGLPGVAERMAFSLGNLAYASVISACGDASMAAHTIGLRIESFVYTPLFAFSTLSTSLVGQSIGRSDFETGYRRGLTISRLAALLMLLLGGLLAALSPILPRAFTDSTEVARMSTLYLILAGLSEPGLGLAMTLSGAIRGAGNTVVPMAVNVSLLFTARVLLSHLLVTRSLFNPPVLGAWLAMFIDVYARGLAFLIIYTRGFRKLARKLV